jgi:hypothetical protein
MIKPNTICLVASLLCVFVCPPARADDLFDTFTIPNTGRSVAARMADFNGDGRTDLMVVSLLGIPPMEERGIRVYLQSEAGVVPRSPDHIIALPAHSGVYDIADLKSEPGDELVVLRPDGITILSIGRSDGPRWDIASPHGTTIATGNDERGFEPFKLVYGDFGPDPWLLLPQFGALVALDAEGNLKADLKIGRRSNYFVIPADSMFSAESDVQLFIDVPKLVVGDVNGDGLVDVASSTRHEIRIFLRKGDGSYSQTADHSIPLGLVTPRDHIRGSGGVACDIKDIDADGKLDLVISHIEGSITDATTTTYVYINRGSVWDLSEPDSTYQSSGAFMTNLLVNLDQEPSLELLRLRVKVSVFEFIELLLTRAIDAEASIYRYSKTEGFKGRPWIRHKLSVPFSFDTFRTKGFVPTVDADLNRDGFKDLVSSGGGDAVEIYLGGGKDPFASRPAKQKMRTGGQIQFADYNSDGFMDFVIFDPHNFDVPVLIGVNRGELPAGED